MYNLKGELRNEILFSEIIVSLSYGNVFEKKAADTMFWN